VMTNFNLLGDGKVNAYLSLIATEGGETVLKSSGLYETTIVDSSEGPRFSSMVLSLDSGF